MLGSAAAAFSKNSEVAVADRSVPLSGSSIFYTTYDSENGTVDDNALLWAHRSVTEFSDVTYSEYYLTFVLVSDESRVDYRKNLAYSWYYNGEDLNKPYVLRNRDNANTEVPEAKPEKKYGYFNMEIGFELNSEEKLSFGEYVISFDSQQNTQTKDGKSTNYIKFIPTEDKTKVDVVITDDKDDSTVKEGGVSLDPSRIKIEFTGKTSDGYNVKVSNEGGSGNTGTFKNVGGNYAKYSSSSTTPVTPLSFSATFPEDMQAPAEGKPAYDNYARMITYSLNGQSFRVGSYSESSSASGFHYGTKPTNDSLGDTYAYYAKKGGKYEMSTGPENEEIAYYTYNPGVTKYDDGHYAASTLNLNDDEPAVLVFDTQPTFVKTGSELPFTFTAIDVLASSPNAKTYYYMLTEEQAKKSDFKANDYNDDKLFDEVTDSQNQFMEAHVGHYLPKSKSGEYNSSAYAKIGDKECKVSAAVKVYYDVYDTSSESLQQTTKVLLDWYVDDGNLLTIGDNNNKYVAVATDNLGATFAYTDAEKRTSYPEAVEGNANSVTAANKWNALVEAYQAKVDEAAKDLKAGSKNYFYLPAMDDITYTYKDASGIDHTEHGSLFSDNISSYRNLRFSVYYSNGTKGSSTSRAYNALSINLTRAKTYVFTVYALDANSNEMYYFDSEGKLQTFAASALWDMRDNKDDYEGMAKYIPWFHFTVEASEITIEDPGDQATAYVDSEYSSINFEVNGVEYDAVYELYRFDNNLYYEAKGTALRYDEYMRWIKGDFDCSEHGKGCKLHENHPEWFTLIPAQNTLTEGSQAYKDFNDYAWDASSRSFVPQDENTFYLVVCTATSNSENLRPAVAYMGISSSARVEKLKGEDTWVQDNLTSIILLSIAGASLIGIILLLVIKPKESEVDLELAAKGGKAKKDKKNKK